MHMQQTPTIKIKIANRQVAVEYVSVDLLRPAEYNPRKWDESAAKKLAESIKRFGLVDPIIVNNAPNRKNIIIGGHFRLEVAKSLGLTQVPVVYVNIPNIQKEKELNLRLNRNTGEWDFELLKDFNVELLLDVGFDDNDLSHIWDDNLGVEDDEFDVEKELEKIKEPKSKLGDIYELGMHRLICGDATSPEVVKKLVQNGEVSMLYCDPPYNIALDYNNGIGAKGKYGGKTNDRKSEEEYRAFLKKTLENGLAVTHPDSHIFYWCDENYIGLIQELYKELGITSKRVCLWIKNNQNVTPQSAFNKVYEPCVYGVRGTPYLAESVRNLNEVLNKEVGTGNRLTDDILDLFNIWLAKRLPSQDYEHPTEKPPTLHEKALRRCTKPGDIILDLFGGSGSTLIACEQLKRRAFLSEIEPIFCDLIIKRYEKLTGKEAKLCK
jgi:DNA modification methylase